LGLKSSINSIIWLDKKILTTNKEKENIQ
jgi:hypothetical protein